MKKLIKKIPVVMMLGFMALALSAPIRCAAAAENTEVQVENADDNEIKADPVRSKAYAASIAIGLASVGGAIAMGISIAKTSESIARQPEADGKIRTSMMLGLVFIETAIIYALIVAILIIFVL